MGVALLLAACSQSVPTRTTPSAGNDLPDVPLTVRPAQPNCSADAQAGLARLVPFNKISGQNYLPAARLQAQADLPANLQSLLFTTRSLINSHYYGFSTVDLQALHHKYEAIFRQGRPGSLALYPIDDAVDETMGQYIDEIKDGHTYYLDAASAQAYRDSQAGNPTPTPRFGFVSALVPDADGVLVLDVTADAPFYAAGLRRGDVLTELNGQAFTRVDTSETKEGDAKNSAAFGKIISAAAALKAPVTLKYLRKGEAKTVQVAARIISSTPLPWGELAADPSGQKHFYLRIPTFSGNGIADRVHALVSQAKADGAADVIVDLRDNGGGLITEFVGAAGAFAPTAAGEVLEDLTSNDVTIRYNAGAGRIEATDACNDTPYAQPIAHPDVWTGKTVILTTEGSASASELFSQVLRLGGNTRIIGEKTYGVGNTFTYIFDEPGNPERALSVTSGRGKLLNGQYASEDVTPDETQPDDLGALAQGNDLALNAAFGYLDK